MAAELEEARALGELVKQGWRPKRTIVYAAWDGEEPGLLGSTEWVEKHGDELEKHAVVYINTDGNGRGFLGRRRLALARGTSSTASPGTSTIPRRSVSVVEAAAGATASRRGTAEVRKRRASRPDLRIDALGSGSDFTPFLQHLGVAVAQSRVRRRGRRRDLSLDLRRLLLVHALFRLRVRVRARARADSWESR